jgi:RNA polymerase sigma-70 factor, ECF subfamily
LIFSDSSESSNHGRHRQKADVLVQERATRDEALVFRIRSGNTDAFYVLIEPYLASVRRLVRSLIRNPADAEDIVQDAILAAFTRLHQLRSFHLFRAWFMQIAANAARMKLRRERSQGVMASLDSTTADDLVAPLRDRLVSHCVSPSRAAENKELRNILRDALRSLPLHYQKVILLRDFQELSARETAAALGLSLSLTRLHLHRARLKLRARLVPLWRKRLSVPITVRAANAR